MTAKGIVKAGPITLALGLIIGGLVLLLFNFGAFTDLGWLWNLWPLLLIGIGLEYFIRKAQNKEQEVHFHVPSIILIIFLLIAGGVSYAAVNIGRNINNFTWGFPFHQANLEYSRTWESPEPVAIGAGELLSVQNQRGRVQLVPAAGDTITVVATIQSPEHGPSRELAERLEPAIVRQEGGVLIMVPEDTNQASRQVLTDLKVMVPGHIDVLVDSAIGRVIAENLEINLKVNGGVGSVELSRIGGNIEVVNNTGQIKVADPGSNITATTNTGSLEVSSASPLAGNYDLQSNTGRVNLTLPKDSDLAIRAESRTGRVSVQGLPDGGGQGGPGDQYSHTLGSGKGTADLRVGTGAIKITAI